MAQAAAAAAGLMTSQPPQPTPAMLAATQPRLHEPQINAAQAMGTGAEAGGELARARSIAQRLGITNLTDDEYDVPTYMRRQQQDPQV